MVSAKSNRIDLPNDVLMTYADELLQQGKRVVITAKGNSMLPFIRDSRDSVCLRKTGSCDIGDIVLAKVPGRGYIMHRIVRMDSDNITMMGDGNLSGTETCPKSAILGTVTEIIKPGRKGFRPSKGRLWKLLKPLRRYLLFIIRRLP